MLGCGGTGRVIKEALKNEFEVTALDVSSEMVQLTKEKYPEIKLLNVDFLDWGSTNEQFDLIIAWDSLRYLISRLRPYKRFELSMIYCLTN